MNIGSNIIALNVGNMLNKKQLDKENLDKKIESGLKINQDLSDIADISVNTELISDENLEASESSIKDIAAAEEIFKNTKNLILEKSAMSILAQANHNADKIINLLD